MANKWIMNKDKRSTQMNTWKRNNYKNEYHSSHWEQRKQEIAVKAPKMMKIGTWNVRSANEEGTIKHIMAAMKRYGIQILALQETKQKGNEIINLSDFTIFNSGGTHTRHFGTAFIVSKLWSERVVDFKPITDRLCLIRLRGDYRKINSRQSLSIV